MADLLDSNGDVKSGALDNVPPSNDASALTTGTLSADRLGAGSIGAAKLAETYLKPDGDGSGLSGLSSTALSVDIPMATGGSITALEAITANNESKIGEYPQLNFFDTAETTLSHTSSRYGEDGSIGLQFETWNDGNRNSRVTAISPTTYSSSGSVQSTNTYTISVSVNQAGNAYNDRGGDIYATPYDDVFVGFKAGATLYNNNSNYIQMETGCFRVNADRTYTGLGGNGAGQGKQTWSWSSSHYFSHNFDRQYPNSPYCFWIYGARAADYSENQASCRMATFNGSTMTSNGISGEERSYWAGKWSSATQTTNGYLLGFSGNTVYIDTGFTANNITTVTPTTYDMVSDYYNSGDLWWLSQTRALFFYTNTDGSSRICLVDFDGNGQPTIQDNVPRNSFPSGSTQKIRETSSGHIVVLGNSGVTSFEYNPSTLEFAVQANGFLATGINESVPSRSGSAIMRVQSGDTMVANYTKTDASRVYKTIDINNFSTFSFGYLGLASETTSSSEGNVYISGVVDGFTGLSPGVQYYVDASLDGSITTSSASGIKVGKAISATQMLMD